MKPRDLAEWERLLLLGLVHTREAVYAPRGVKAAFHGFVASYIRLGWLPKAGGQLCVVCHGPAQVWHHPSYARGFHDVVQSACVQCHADTHAQATRFFVQHPGEDYNCWRTDEMAAYVDHAMEQIRADTQAPEAGN